jgi:hypothetical protein
LLSPSAVPTGMARVSPRRAAQLPETLSSLQGLTQGLPFDEQVYAEEMQRMRQEDTGRGGGGGGERGGSKGARFSPRRDAPLVGVGAGTRYLISTPFSSRDKKRGVGEWGSDADESEFIEILKRIQNLSKKREQFLSNTRGRKGSWWTGEGARVPSSGKKAQRAGPGIRRQGRRHREGLQTYHRELGLTKGGGGEGWRGGRERKDRVA